MNKFHLRVYNKNDNGHMVATCSLANELELVEKSIELYKETGGGVGYKQPEDGDGFVSLEGAILKEGPGGGFSEPGYRLTFTPPKPEPVESEWEELKRDLRCNPSFVRPDEMLRLIDALDRRYPAGDGK